MAQTKGVTRQLQVMQGLVFPALGSSVESAAMQLSDPTDTGQCRFYEECMPEGCDFIRNDGGAQAAGHMMTVF